MTETRWGGGGGGGGKILHEVHVSLLPLFSLSFSLPSLPPTSVYSLSLTMFSVANDNLHFLVVVILCLCVCVMCVYVYKQLHIMCTWCVKTRLEQIERLQFDTNSVYTCTYTDPQAKTQPK